MLRYTIKRILWMIPIVLCVSILVFTLMYFAPGEPAKIILGPNASVDQIEVLEKELGLDQPYLVRLVNYLNQAFLHGDLGNSWQTNVSISESLMQRTPRRLDAFFLAGAFACPAVFCQAGLAPGYGI